MNARLLLVGHVMLMLTAPILLVALSALVDLDTQGMDLVVKVRIPTYSWIQVMMVSFTSLAIPPPLSLSTSSQVNIGPLKELNITCESVGDFSGPVMWMRDGRNISNIG